MTTEQLRDFFNTNYGMNKWPDSYEVDHETYANVCQSVFNQTWENENIVTLYRGGWLGKIAFGKNNGIMFKNVELLLSKSTTREPRM